jgi:hypothetical protein
MTIEDADRIAALLEDTGGGPLEWVPVGREELRELLRVYRGQLAMQSAMKYQKKDVEGSG